MDTKAFVVPTSVGYFRGWERRLRLKSVLQTGSVCSRHNPSVIRFKVGATDPYAVPTVRGL